MRIAGKLCSPAAVKTTCRVQAAVEGAPLEKEVGLEGKVPVEPLTLCKPPLLVKMTVSPPLTVRLAGVKPKLKTDTLCTVA